MNPNQLAQLSGEPSFLSMLIGMPVSRGYPNMANINKYATVPGPQGMMSARVYFNAIVMDRAKLCPQERQILQGCINPEVNNQVFMEFPFSLRERPANIEPGAIEIYQAGRRFVAYAEGIDGTNNLVNILEIPSDTSDPETYIMRTLAAAQQSLQGGVRR